MAAEENQAPPEHPTAASWETIFGMFADSEGFEEAVRLGREWREAQNAEDDAACPSHSAVAKPRPPQV